jgi:hypothetical protein
MEPAMEREGQRTLVAINPDMPGSRAASSGIRATSLRSIEAPAGSPPDQPVAAEATLSLEPLRVPIAAIVQSTLVAEREALERMSADLRVELDRLREWRVREETLRVDQTALYRQAAEHWEAAINRAQALCEATGRLEGVTYVLQAAVEAAVVRFWQRALLAAWVLSFVGLGLVAGLCGVVWLALAHH